MQFQRYEKYKQSGIEWLGEIPEGWEVVRVKDIIKYIDQGWSPVAENRLVEKQQWGVLKISSVKYGDYIESEHKALNKDDIISTIYYRYRVEIDDILITRSNTPKLVGDVCYVEKVNFNLIYSDLIYKLRLNMNKLSGKYFKYFFISCNCRTQVEKSAKGLNDSMVKISQSNIKNWNLFFPLIQMQNIIANYLDQQTALIDKKIELLKAKKQRYNHLKQTLINEVVTKGLDAAVEMKESGIEWIGHIPKHWNVKRGKELFKENSKSKITANEGEKIGKYKFFTSSNEQSKWLDYFVKNSESLLFSTGGSAGINYCEKEYSYSTDTWSIYGNKKIYLKYFAYYFESILHEINSLGFRGAGLEHLQKDFINLGKIIVPPKSEQIDIANYLDEKTSKIDEIIKKIDENILALQEYRKTLINDIVTGKVKIL